MAVIVTKDIVPISRAGARLTELADDVSSMSARIAADRTQREAEYG